MVDEENTIIKKNENSGAQDSLADKN